MKIHAIEGININPHLIPLSHINIYKLKLALNKYDHCESRFNSKKCFFEKIVTFGFAWVI